MIMSYVLQIARLRYSSSICFEPELLKPSPLDFDTNDEKYNPLSGTPPYLISIVLPSSLLSGIPYFGSQIGSSRG